MAWDEKRCTWVPCSPNDDLHTGDVSEGVQYLDMYAATTPHREKLLLLFVAAGYVRNVADDSDLPRCFFDSPPLASLMC